MRRHAMTLVEVMLAITIFGMMATMVYSALSSTARHKARAEADLERHHMHTAALERMARELPSAYVSAHRNPNESLVVMESAFHGKDHGDRDRLDFTSFSHQRLYRNAHESDQNEVSYFVTRNPENERVYCLARREQARPDDDAERGGSIEILVDEVRSFNLEYLEPDTLRWVRDWDARSSGDHLNRLPLQVKIVLEVPHPRDPRRSITLGTRVSLPIQYGLNHAIYQ